MKKLRRAGTATLERVSPLLDELRHYSTLHETRPGVFYLGSAELLHFHETPDGIVADVRLAKGYERLPVNTRTEQLDLLDLVSISLAPKETKAMKRHLDHKQRRSQR